MQSSLYRPESVNSQQQRLMGEVDLSQPLSISLWALVMALLLAALFCFLLFSELHRKERVQGSLVPSHGTVHVVAQRPGTLEQIHVREGDEVEKGDALFTIVHPRHYNHSGSLESVLLENSLNQLRLNQLSLSDNQWLLESALKRNQELRDDLQQRHSNLAQQKQFAQQRLVLHLKKLEALNRVASSGRVSPIEISQAKDSVLTMQQGVAVLDHNLLGIQRELRAAAAENLELPFRFEFKTRQLRSERADLESKLEEVRASFRSVIRASKASRITTVQATIGQQIVPGDEMLSLVSEGSDLLAELYLPSKSVGLVAIGDQAILRFDAFPYQKFGQMSAEIVQIDQSLLRPDRHVQIGIEPVYRVRLHLGEQSIKLKDNVYPLKIGMLVEADILLERRRLFDWFIEPIIGFQRRMA
jgi:membrane fusion protein